MKTIALLNAIFLLITSNLFSNIDEEEVIEKLALIQSTGNSGRDFWFTIPPVYEVESGGYVNFVKVLVVSALEAEVKVSIGKSNSPIGKIATPGKVISFDLPLLDAQPISHAGVGETRKLAKVYKNSAIHVESDVPIIVYVIVKALYNTDGFFAIPTKAMGTKYINFAYNEPNLENYGWLSPFTGVVGVYDSTHITFTKGSGNGANDVVPFEDGSLIRTGRKKDFSISKGDVMLMSINGKGQDLSGSIFEGDKPFAIVSGVNCATIPSGVYGCDYIVNMELPVKYWGEDYFVTPMLKKTFNGIIRVYASEDSTIVYRDGTVIDTIPKGGGADIGEGYLEMRLWPKFDGKEEVIPPKLAHISADKPIAVVYYNTGGTDDSPKSDKDPFMMQIQPIENAEKSTLIFSPNQISDNNKFSENSINITFSLVNNEIPDDLLIAEMSSSTIEPQFEKLKDKYDATFNKFESSYNGKYYASKNILLEDIGAYIIKSDLTEFVTESFGYRYYESYGFPSSFNLREQYINDASAPLITYEQQNNGDILLEDGLVIDLPNEGSKRSNLADIYLLESENYEFNWEPINEEFIPGISKQLNWSLTVMDKNKSASAILYSVDMAGNDTIVLIEYDFFNSIEPQETLSEYMLVTLQNIEILPNAIADGFTELEIFDMNGSKVAKADITAERNISLNSLLSGSYVITLKSDERLLTRKMNVVR